MPYVPSDFAKSIAADLKAADKNGDGELDREELAEVVAKLGLPADSIEKILNGSETVDLNTL